MIDSNIRNFCIIAHIDHGKSTLADRLLELTNTIQKRAMKAQLLDTMDIEQERGITIKLQPVRMDYEKDGKHYILNLIDTPGHVDFTYEVSRSLAACEGAILVVDASQGIEAQTLANTYLAIEHNLEIIPVMNKIDLPFADPERVGREIENTFGIPKEDILAISAKDGTNVDKLLDLIVKQIPPAKIENTDQTKALIFDSVYDQYKGVVAFVRVNEGTITVGDKVTLLNTKTQFEVLEVGYFRPAYEKARELKSGEVGYVVTGLKSVGEARVGDTIWQSKTTKLEDAVPLPGYKKVKPFVFASIFCTEGEDFPLLRDALDKLSLNDSALQFEPEQSTALGYGFRCGFLGLLHLEIVQERLEREYDLDLVVTAPSVSYVAILTNGDRVEVSTPSQLPDRAHIDKIEEPWVDVEILVPKDYVGNVMKLCQENRGHSKNIQYLDENRVLLVFEMPLANIVVDFYDHLKSTTSGYASMSYEFKENRAGDLVKVDILIAGEEVDALSVMTHRSEAQEIGSRLTKRLKQVIPKAQFEIALQAAIGAKVIARESISALRKDVIAKLYGGDRTRKDKLLKKQKAGKKRMKQVGKINLPQEAFLAILKRD
ncbi:elongation factor 4 [Candidatus Peregrinibacteria bacterium CG11_big_fil_rev_8_21_14_0_20_41_10]|nr:MAG: elongation factor 4 [Candidatus Peregrinibacteria bacterium CG11_big_fil_rev_8_21_14_0_20_41_10]PJC38417.1 MAG: elongation factor 4 [Candidatus Peregrinibacteria bacterium CG_4_9_14_0_2_um_filter_41_14]